MNGTDHNPDRRAEASADPRLLRRQKLDLTVAAEGVPTWGKWTPVQGPHLKVVRTKHAGNRTGVPGIAFTSFQPRKARRVDAFVVNLGKTCRRFNIRTLGREEAWRRAVRLRAEHELKIRAVNAQIVEARKKGAQ